jgi:putative copper export protein
MQVRWPSFNMSDAELLLSFVRGIVVAGLLSTFGASAFRVLIATAGPKLPRGTEASELGVLVARWSAMLAVLTMLVWLMLETGTIIEAESFPQALAAVPSVIWDTSFGHILAAQVLAVLGTAIALMIDRRPSLVTAIVFAGIAVLLQAGHSHAFAMHHWPLLLSQCLHLLAAGAWLGGLLPLLLLVREAPPNVSTTVAQRFSILGVICVLILVGTAAFQGWLLGGGVAGLFGTAYGWVALLKLALFTALLVVAALNQFRFVPAVAQSHTRTAKLTLVRSIGVETAVGLLVVLAAGLLSSLEPGMHAHL